MSIKRKRRRNPLHPRTSVHDWGVKEIIDKMNRALSYLDGVEDKKKEKKDNHSNISLL
jgi:hypothetical protein